MGGDCPDCRRKFYNQLEREISLFQDKLGIIYTYLYGRTSGAVFWDTITDNRNFIDYLRYNPCFENNYAIINKQSNIRLMH